MKKSTKIIYYTVTGLLTLTVLPALIGYFFFHSEVVEVFEGLGFPAALIYPLGIAKLLGLVAIWTNKSRLLKELAYAGFAIELCSAAASHLAAGDEPSAVVAPLAYLLIVVVSFIYHRKLFVSTSENLA